MKNVEIKYEGTKAIITVDLAINHGLSSTGKSVIIGTTEGNQPIGKDGKTFVGLNVYRKN